MVSPITYAGKLGESLALLDTCRQVNIGKNTTFRLGRVGISQGKSTQKRVC